MEALQTDCQRYGHAWVGGMVYVHQDDAEAVNAERIESGIPPLTCEDCGIDYVADVDD